MNDMKLYILAMTIFPLLAACGENPTQKFELHITDEDGKPLSGVTGKAWFNTSKKSGTGIDSYLVTGTTDDKGIVELQGETLHYQTAIGAEAVGYYPASKGGFWMKGKKGSRWEPWPVKENLILKKIVAPLPMYAVGSGDGMRIDFPRESEDSYGYDLFARDWVEPFGSGRIADFVFKQFVGFSPSPQEPMTGSMTLSFSNDEDGILAMPVGSDGGSELLGPHVAPTGFYAKDYAFTAKPLDQKKLVSADLANMVWVFRIRTVTDNEGKIASTHYGKIYGYPQIISMRGVPAIRFSYYLSGKANQPNLEWNMKTNLFKDLPEQNWPRNP